MQKPKFEEAIQYAIDKLQSELPQSFTYHNLWHTQVEVATAVSHFAEMEELPELEKRLLMVAVAFHDVGFITFPPNHEALSIKEAKSVLPEFGFKPCQVQKICNMILATRLPQTPHTLAEQILADADLEVLGRPDFFERNQALRDEFAYLSRPFSKKEWLENQLSFLQNHTYFTNAARECCREQKLRNIESLQDQLDALAQPK